MLFIYIHTHPLEKCLIDKAEEARQMFTQVLKSAQQASVKIVGVYMAPQEHTTFAILEGNDFAAMSRAVHPMTAWGTARLIPVVPVEQATGL